MKIGEGEAKLEGAAKIRLEFKGGKVSATDSIEVGATAGIIQGPKVGLGMTVSRTEASVDLNTGHISGQEPAKAEPTVGISNGDTTLSPGQHEVALGEEEGDGLLAGGEVSITRDGLAAAAQVVQDIKDLIQPPAPPPPSLPRPPSPLPDPAQAPATK